jgi:excinuclease ABC subunit C
LGLSDEKMKNILKEKAATASDSPGVYLMKDASGKVIYIGKAKSLRKRLKGYFHSNISPKTQALILNAFDIEYRLCPNESMALILEASLVHKYKPKYNVSLRDDKSFPMVKITNGEFPALGITRKREADGARYFGPYTNAGLLKKAMKAIRRYFPYLVIKQPPNEARIDRFIGLSPEKDLDKKAYARRIRDISLILEGKSESLVKRLFKDMSVKSRHMDFEGAGKIRDQIIALGALARGSLDPGCNLGLEELRKVFRLKKVPERIEAFDISDISGKEACGSMVSFYNGQPDKGNYRRFRIKSVEGIDDYGMLREVVKRRYCRLLRDNLMLPDLIIIDGGRGHLLSAERELAGLKIDVPLISIAKKEENIYIRGRKNPIRLNGYNFGLNLIRRIRDEAHRFALAYHHFLRRKKVIGR